MRSQSNQYILVDMYNGCKLIMHIDYYNYLKENKYDSFDICL